VLGVELSRLAVEAFFAENGLVPSLTQAAPDGPPLERFRADEIEILCGDFFDLRPQDLAGVGAVYDRASLIALPPETRPRYAAHLERLLPARVPRLLVTLEYDQSRMAGPPFSVPAEEVAALFGAEHRIDPVAELDCLDESPRFRERGLARLVERVYRLDPAG
jgi:thiopurine S-methyltransferase